MKQKQNKKNKSYLKEDKLDITPKNLNSPKNVESKVKPVKETVKNSKKAKNVLNGSSKKEKNPKSSPNKKSILSTEENGTNKTNDTNDMKTVSVAFPKVSSACCGAALKEILENSTRTQGLVSLCLKFDSSAEAQKNLSKIEALTIDGEPVEVNYRSATSDPLRRIITTAPHMDVEIMKKKFEATEVKRLNSPNTTYGVYCFTFKSEEDALIAEKSVEKIRPFNKKRDLEEETSQNASKKIKLDGNIKEEEEKMEDSDDEEEGEEEEGGEDEEGESEEGEEEGADEDAEEEEDDDDDDDDDDDE